MNNNELIFWPDFPRNLALVSVKEAATATHLSEYILRADLKTRKIGNKDYVRVKELLEYIDRSE